MEAKALHVPIIRLVLFAPVAVLCLLILAPVAYSAIWSVWGTETAGLLDTSASPQWYLALATDEIWRDGAVQSLSYSIPTAFVAPLLGLLAAFAVRISTSWLNATYIILIMSISALPMLIYALGLRIFAGDLGWSSDALILLGYTIVVLPFVYFPIAAATDSVTRSSLWSSMTLGASPSRTLLAVVVPQIGTGLAVACVIALLLAWDELVMPLILLDGSRTTISRHLWDLVTSDVKPFPAVIATLTYAILLIALGLGWIARRSWGRLIALGLSWIARLAWERRSANLRRPGMGIAP